MCFREYSVNISTRIMVRIQEKGPYQTSFYTVAIRNKLKTMGSVTT